MLLSSLDGRMTVVGGTRVVSGAEKKNIWSRQPRWAASKPPFNYNAKYTSIPRVFDTPLSHSNFHPNSNSNSNLNSKPKNKKVFQIFHRDRPNTGVDSEDSDWCLVHAAGNSILLTALRNQNGSRFESGLCPKLFKKDIFFKIDVDIIFQHLTPKYTDIEYASIEFLGLKEKW